MSETIAVGIIGAGFGQHVHVPAFRADPRCRVAALCASTPERARAVADRLQIPRAYGDWRDMVADPDLSALSIAVPPPLQAAIVLAAAARGKHVFCEKPIAVSVADAAAMVQAVETAGVAHAVNFIFPEIGAWKRAKQIISEGTLGQLRHFALSWRVETRAARAGIDSWKLRRAEGGGTLNNFVSHSLYSLRWLFGPMAIAAARLSPAGSAGELRVDAFVEWSGGVTGTIAVASDAFLGPGHRLEVYGASGTLILENRTADYITGFTLSLGTRDSGGFRAEEIHNDWDSSTDGRQAATASIVRRFVDAIVAGGSVVPNLRDGLNVQKLIDAIRDADRSRSVAPAAVAGAHAGAAFELDKNNPS